MILGIDPGLENTGWGVIETRKQKAESRMVQTGVIKTKKSQRSQERLKYIYEEIKRIIKKYGVEEMAMESLYFAKNAKSALKVAEAIGVVKVAAAETGVEVFEYSPLQIKMALVGYGRAEKGQVEEMVKRSLNLKETIRPSHAADALAAALTHEFTSSFVRE